MNPWWKVQGRNIVSKMHHIQDAVSIFRGEIGTKNSLGGAVTGKQFLFAPLMSLQQEVYSYVAMWTKIMPFVMIIQKI